MADMTTIKGRIQETIYPNGTGAITAESHQALLLEMVDNINEVKQDVLVSGQNIRPLISGESLLGGDALAVLGTRFIYELENQKLFAMIDGALQDLDPWMANRAVHSQVAQVIEIQKEGLFQELVPLTIKNKAGLAALCWEYDGMIYEASIEDDGLAVVSKPKGNQFDKEGNYPLLHVGTADDLAGRGESVPAEFGFRASGGKSIKDGRAYIKRIKGNSVVWNQHIDFNNPIAFGTSSVSLENGEYILTLSGGSANAVQFPSAPFVQGRSILFLCEYTSEESAGNINMKFGSAETAGAQGLTFQATKANSIFTINSAIQEGKGAFWIWTSNASIIRIKSLRVIDLTKAFPDDWQNINTIEEFNARVATLGVDLNAYNEGEVIHMNTEGIKSVGDNAWDEEWELGRYAPSTGLPNTDEGIRSKNSIKVLPNENYWCSAQNDIFAHFYDAEGNLITNVYSGQYNYLPIKNKQFTTPANAATMTFYVVGTTTYNHDILISLVHSGWKQDTDAGYQPYWQDTLPLPIIRKYFPDGMKSAGTAHDEIRFNKASGKWEYSKGKIKSVDMGSFNYATGSTNLANSKRMRALTKISDAVLPASDAQVANILCGSYIAVSSNNNWQNSEGVCIGADGYLYVYDKEKQDAASFKADMAGVMLYYESNDWEWVELDEADQNFRDYYNVADFGTEQSQSEVPSAPFSADIIYQFNAVDMIREHELEITELQKVIATMQAQLTSLINGGQ